MSKNKIEIKRIGGSVTEHKEVNRDGVNLGIVEGYIATWDLDSGNGYYRDQFEKGAFLESIKEHKKRNNRQIRLKDHHGRTIGGFPIETVKEDEKGLFGIGEINLDVQQGSDAYALIKQGVLSDFSIGFSVVKRTFDEESEIRTIHKAKVWEGSIVDEPMNQHANITAVKSLHSFGSLPIADINHTWDEKKASERLADYLADNKDVEEVKTIVSSSFMWSKLDASNSDCKLQIVDVVDGNLMVIPDAVIEAANIISKSADDGGQLLDSETMEMLGIPLDDKPEIIKSIEKYCAKMNIPAPFEQEEKQYFTENDLETMSVRQFEDILRKTGSLSRVAVKALSSRVYTEEKEGYNVDAGVNQKILEELNSIKSSLNL